MKKLGILVCAASILIGCGGNPHPKMVSFTPASVVIDYSKNDTLNPYNKSMANIVCE